MLVPLANVRLFAEACKCGSNGALPQCLGTAINLQYSCNSIVSLQTTPQKHRWDFKGKALIMARIRLEFGTLDLFEEEESGDTHMPMYATMGKDLGSGLPR